MSAEQPNEEYEAAKAAWQEALLSPLWESAVAFREGPGSQTALFWRWSSVRPLVDAAIRLVSPRDVERRVLMFTDPNLNSSRRATTTLGLNAGLQILLPGESARPHRHSMDAIRFVLEGEGAVTVVDGKEYAATTESIRDFLNEEDGDVVTKEINEANKKKQKPEK